MCSVDNILLNNSTSFYKNNTHYTYRMILKRLSKIISSINEKFVSFNNNYNTKLTSAIFTNTCTCTYRNKFDISLKLFNDFSTVTLLNKIILTIIEY